jgi:uncharacterized cupin superfamily protein
MGVPEARIEQTPGGAVPAGGGWYVMSLRGARGFAAEGHGVFCPFESPDARFEDVGINVHVLLPGERSALYHAESAQEGFLVLAGECVAVVEDEERPLRQWDYLHCPAGTAHALVGAGRGPCAILMVGARRPDATIEYPVSEIAARYDLSVPAPSDNARDAYESAGWVRESRPVPMPWPD